MSIVRITCFDGQIGYLESDESCDNPLMVCRIGRKRYLVEERLCDVESGDLPKAYALLADNVRMGTATATEVRNKRTLERLADTVSESYIT